MKKYAMRILFGITAIGAAILLIGNIAGWWSVTSFSGWWTVFLIVPGLAGIISCGFSIWSLCLVGLGLWFLASSRGWLREVPTEVGAIVILAVLGIWLIFGAFRNKKQPNSYNPLSNSTNDNDNFLNYSAFFGGIDVHSECASLEGGRIQVFFGGAKLDLRKAEIVDGAVLDVESIFGGAEVFVPEYCNIRLEGTPIFGGATNKTDRVNNPDYKTLIVRYKAVFGGVELK